MKKLLFILLLVLLASCWTNQDQKKQEPISIKESTIKENLDEKTWYLNLSNKAYTYIPDFCTNKNILNSDIKVLDLSNNNIQKVDQDLTCLDQLEIINLSSNNIDSFISLWQPRFLHTIKLSKNQLTDVSNLSYYPNIANLDISYNKLEDLNFLKNLTELRTLKLQHNNISSLSWLEKFHQIISIDLSNNNISDKYQLNYLRNLSSLESLNIWNNPLEQDIIDKIHDWSKK